MQRGTVFSLGAIAALVGLLAMPVHARPAVDLVIAMVAKAFGM